MDSKERLAVALELPFDDIDKYISGELPLPDNAFLVAIDIVANGGARKGA